MKNFFKNYKQTIILLASIIIGAIVGLVFKEKTSILSPLGDLFINMMFIIIVPLIFLTITTSIAKMKSGKRLGKVLITIFVIFFITSIIALLVGFLTTFKTNLVSPNDTEAIKSSFVEPTEEAEELTILERTVKTLSVSDFSLLLSKSNLIALLVVSLITGFAIRMSKEKGEKFKELLESANDVLMNFICLNFILLIKK